MAKMIDITPTWRSALQLFLAGYSEGVNDDVRATALKELQRMASIADKAGEYQLKLKTIDAMCRKALAGEIDPSRDDFTRGVLAFIHEDETPA